MNNREFATFILMGVVLVLVLCSRIARGAALDVLKHLLTWKIAIPLLSLLATIVCSLWLFHFAGFWADDAFAATFLWFLVSGFAWFLHIGNAATDNDFFKRRILEAVGVGAFLEFFVNLQVMPLPFELLVQAILLPLVPTQVIARTRPDWKPAATFLTSLITVISLVLLLFTIHGLIVHRHDLDGREILSEFLLPIWLTVTAVPCIYIVSLYAGYESFVIHLRIMNSQRLPKFTASVGAIVGLGPSLTAIGGFRGRPARDLAKATTFRQGLSIVRGYRHDRKRDALARRSARQRLVDNAGLPGTDEAGLTRDRREFAATKAALRWLATCHMGWYQRQDQRDRYRPDLLEVLGSFESHGLPLEHGIHMKVSTDGQAWYAYRRTPSGHVFGIGASEKPPSQWFYDGDEPPSSYPKQGFSWTSFMEDDRPEWAEESRV